jgi:nucleoside-diphosphate-sugar epimerase
MSQTQNILIFGATGWIGKHITNAIVNEPSFKQIAIFTSDETLKSKAKEIEALESRGVRVITGDLTSADDLNAAYKGHDTIVSCVGRPVINTQLKMVELAEKHPDVKRFFPSEYGTDIEYGPQSQFEKPHQQKLKVRAALKEVNNLEYTYVVTGPYGDGDRGLYLGAHPEDREATGTFDVSRKRAVLIEDGNVPISLTTMRDVGKLVVAALKHPDAVKNRALRVNSFTATPNDIVKEFEKQSGGERWNVSYTSLDEVRKSKQTRG